MKEPRFKIAFWSPQPNPHLGPIFLALREMGIDVKVIYSTSGSQERRALGWPHVQTFSKDDFALDAMGDPWHWLVDWRERIHIVPGFSQHVHRKLVLRLCLQNVHWALISEVSSTNNILAQVLKYLHRRLIGLVVRKYALGALAIGWLAAQQFESWGVPVEKIGFLAYAPELPAPTDPLQESNDQELRSASNTVKFLYIGRLVSIKRVDLLIRAFAQLSSAVDSSLSIVGIGPNLQNLQRLANELGVNDRLDFRDAVPFTEVSEVYRSASVSVLPSAGDGWGCTLNEAAQSGLALIASTNCGAAYHLISPGINGFRFRSGSVESLRRCMQSYLNDIDLVKIHGQASRTISKSFLPMHQAELLCSQLRSWIAQHQCA